MRSIAVEDVPGFGSVWTEEDALRGMSKVVTIYIVPINLRGERVSPYLLWPVA